MPTFKLGKHDPAKLLSTPALSEHTDAIKTWPVVPAQGWEYGQYPIELDSLGNDEVGNCVIVAAMHYLQNATANTSNPLTPTKELAIRTYSDITGYDPSDPNSDRGTCFETQLFPFWKKHGIPMLDKDNNEVRSHIYGWASLDLLSVPQQRYASYTFGGLLWGIQCQQAQLDETDHWAFVPGSPVVGGHGVNQPGQGSVGGHMNSWRYCIPFRWDFTRHVADEAYIVVTPEWIDRQDKSPSGLDLNGLIQAWKAL